MRVLVVGAGAIGGQIAGHLAEVGIDVTALTTNPRIAEAVERGGFRLTGDGEARAVPGRIVLQAPEGERYDLCLLATQPPQVEEAARAALPALAEGGRMVCLQNGLCEERVEAIAGPGRVIGAIVAWGASMPEPGLYERTSSGGFVLGIPRGASDETVRALGALFEAIGPVEYSSNLLGARWSKLALNCAISSIGTVAGERLGPLCAVRRYRRLALEIMTEAVAVARAEGVTLEKVAGTLDLEWIALREGERRRAAGAGLAAKHALLIAVGLRYRRLRSSMLAAIERGRTPAIDFLNGEVVARGEARGVRVPVNAAVVRAVKRIAAGEARSSRALLDELYESTGQVR